MNLHVRPFKLHKLDKNGPFIDLPVYFTCFLLIFQILYLFTVSFDFAMNKVKAILSSFLLIKIFGIRRNEFNKKKEKRIV